MNHHIQEGGGCVVPHAHLGVFGIEHGDPELESSFEHRSTIGAERVYQRFKSRDVHLSSVYRDFNEAIKGSNPRTYIALGQDHLIFRMTPLKLTIIPATTTGDGPSPPLGRPLGPSPQASQVALL